MTIDTVAQILKDNNIRSDIYKIDDKYLEGGVYYLYFDVNLNKWVTFFYDKGACDNNRYFSTEDEACRKFLKMIFSSPSNFTDFNIKRYFEFLKLGENILKKYKIV